MMAQIQLYVGVFICGCLLHASFARRLDVDDDNWGSDTSAPTDPPTEAPTDYDEYDFYYKSGWVGSLLYASIAAGVMISACLIAYYQSHKHYHQVMNESNNNNEQPALAPWEQEQQLCDEHTSLLKKSSSKSQMVA